MYNYYLSYILVKYKYENKIFKERKREQKKDLPNST